MKVAGLGKRTCVRSLMTIIFLVVALSSLTSVSIASAQTQATGKSSRSTIIASSPFSSASILSVSADSATGGGKTVVRRSSTSSSTLSTSSPSMSTTTSSVESTSSSTSSLTSDTSTDGTWTTVTTRTKISTITTVTVSGTSTSGYYYTTYFNPPGEDDSISFSPPYWLCTDVSVTFTGPLVESGLYGDTLQFQYFQYSPSYPSVLYPIFTDPGLTVTSDSVNYWINYGEYAPVNFAYMPNIAVKVVDVTPKSNGYAPGLLFMELTNITPEGGQSCGFDSPPPPPAPIPEFQVAWVMIMASVVLGLAFLQVHKHHRFSKPSTDRRFHAVDGSPESS